MKAVSYIRVSTEQQEKSGLGIEAQRAAVRARLNGAEPFREYIEIESGKNNQRPMLQQALETCKRTGGTLVVAKLDRLSRNMAFIANLMESGAEFVACDLPDANRFTLHIFGALAEQERTMISIRTRAALQVAKARGQILGKPENLKNREKGTQRANITRSKKADEFADRMRGVIEVHKKGGLTLTATADKLNEAGELTATGRGKWTAAGVRAVIMRIGG